MKLYLVQHGEAVAKENDPDRPLSEKGITDVKRIGRALTHSKVAVERVIHSGKLRARQTAEILASEIAPGVQLEIHDQIRPNDNPGSFDLLNDNRSTDTMVVGHLPFMAKLVSLLVAGDDSLALVAYKPGSIVCLQRIEADSWQINWMLRPELLE